MNAAMLCWWKGRWRTGVALLLWLLATAAPGLAQPRAPYRMAHAQQRRATIPYQAQRNLIIVSARLNGQGPYNFVLDTGVSV